MPVLPLANLQLWLTPLWMVSLGVTIAVLVLLAVYGVLWLVSRRVAERMAVSFSEGMLLPISYVLGAFVAVFVLGAATAPTSLVLDSFKRLPYVRPIETTVEIPANVEDHEVTAVSFQAEELTSYQFTSDQDVRIGIEPGQAYGQSMVVLGGEADGYEWSPGSKNLRGFVGKVDKLYVTNEGDAPAQLTLRFDTDVRVPEVHHVRTVVISVLSVFALYFALQWLLPAISNISVATAKEAVGQPLFLLFLLIGGAALLIYIVIPYNTFGEDVKMLKDSGLTTIMVLAMIFAMWTASATVAEEIEGKTALTLLSKPISRRQFIIGKYFGILWPVLVMFVVLGPILMASVSYKVVYDARETSNPQPKWEECYDEMIQVPSGLTLAFMETAILSAISVAISTRLPMMPNLIICGSIYVLGHLGPLIVQSSIGQIEFVAFFGRLISVVIPNLDNLNIQAAIAAGVPVPSVYLWMAAGYTLLYCTAAMLLALILFEDRDVA
ncbi:ABC-2 family transporter protein [Posidoniimonas polymericola]|uniref:ABC-2 family transporter protein n=1 Tax=Posidoniimonas polymericola TaxID=2528002 RepID=A0A5C5XYW1_9BACT|nr:ABC-2 transporter permease [Posidoniimonas polymericola]TWT67729.1 ABC-2 family transporter protein [Posidoniimonas polymericola]